jgi:hypothetical protein
MVTHVDKVKLVRLIEYEVAAAGSVPMRFKWRFGRVVVTQIPNALSQIKDCKLNSRSIVQFKTNTHRSIMIAKIAAFFISPFLTCLKNRFSESESNTDLRFIKRDLI